MYRSFDTVEDMKKFIEGHVPMKRGWTGEWEASTLGRTFAYKVFNSKHARVRGRGIVVRFLEGCDDTCTSDCGSCKGAGNRPEKNVYLRYETPLYFATVQEQGFDPMSAKRLREQRIANFGTEWRIRDRIQILGPQR